MIRDILKEELVKVETEVSCWQDCVKVGGNLLVEANKIESEFIQSMIDVVNELGPYMILLPEVALFHGKPSEAVKEVCLSFVTFNQDIYFSEFDNQRIKCCFCLGAVDSDSHMKMLASLVPLLQDEKFIELATSHGTKNEIMEIIKNY